MLQVLTKGAMATRRAMEATSFQVRGEQQGLVIDAEDLPEVARDDSRQKKNRSAPLRGQGAPAFPAHLRS